jgi:seryl-tRNA(Sec) selenium transferase
MTHREYTLTVEHPIYERLDSDTKAVHKHVGQTMTLNREDFERIKEGHDIIRYVTAGHGMTASVTFGKENFSNEVAYTDVTIETGIAKLGKRKSK